MSTPLANFNFAEEPLASLALIQAAEAIVVCDLQGRIRQASQVVLQFCDGDPLRRPFTAAFPLQLEASEPFNLGPVLRGATVHDADVTLVLQDRTLAFILNAAPLLESSRIVGCVITLTDITERKLRAHAIERSERRLQKLIEEGSDVFLVLDRNAKLRYRSAAGQRLTGWSDEEVFGQPLTNFVVPEDLATARDAIARSLSHPDQSIRVELGLRHQDGSRVDMEVRGRNLLEDPDVQGIVVAARDITAQRRSREAQRESNQVLESIVNAIPVRVFWKDKDLVYLGCNAIFARDAGVATPEEIVGKDDYQLGWHDQAELYRSDDREVIETGNAKSLVEELQTTPDGGSITLLTSKMPLRDSGGAIRGVIGTYLDITERKRSELALHASEVRYRRLFEAAKDGIFILDADTAEIVDVNPYLCDLLGLSREDVVGQKIWELVPFRDVLASKLNFRELQRLEYIRYEDLPLLTADGREIAVEFVSNVYEIDDEKVIQCNVRDITERKKSAEETARLVWAVEQSAESIVMTDSQGQIVYVNPAFERISGWTREEAVGENPRILKSGRQDDAFYRKMWQTLSRGESWSGCLVNRRKDGSLFEEEATISPLRDATGVIVNYVAVKRDVTREKALQQQLFQAQKMEAVGCLASGVAHDFNNLLGVIVGYGELVQSGLSDGDPLRDDVAQILKAADRATSSTRQLLVFGRKQVAQLRVLDLNAIVSSSEKMLKRLLGEEIELVSQLGANLGKVNADPGQLEQVLMNLALNARDAMPEGGEIIVETRNRDLEADFAEAHSPIQPGRYVQLSFSDSGVGMDAATKARVFEPFFTTKEAGKGTGLGLSTVYGIVHQSGGYVWLYSEVGLGTTFKVYLPRIEDEVQEPAADDLQDALPRGVETVLLVEDEAALRTLIQRVLEASGYSVLVAHDGIEALQIARTHVGPIQLLLTDVIMPGLSGPKLAELAAPVQPDMKVLYVSGYGGDQLTRQGLTGPKVPLLTKPFGPRAVLRRVRKALDGN